VHIAPGIVFDEFFDRSALKNHPNRLFAYFSRVASALAEDANDRE
jgi:hypothetical protein